MVCIIVIYYASYFKSSSSRYNINKNLMCTLGVSRENVRGLYIKFIRIMIFIAKV